MRSTLWLLWMAFAMVACYEPVEGCLNPRANNFDLDADEACTDCCTLPELSISFNAVWDDGTTVEDIRLDTFYLDAMNNPWRFKRLRFYWSDFIIENIAGDLLEIQDSLDVAIAMGVDTSMTTVKDDFLLVDIDGANGSFTIGTFEATGIMRSLDGVMGIAQPVNSAVITSFSSSHPLAPQLGQMNFNDGSGYIFAKLEYYQDTTAVDTIPRVINMLGDDILRSFSFDLPVPTQLVEGFNQVLVMEQNIAQLFAGVNVRLADTTVLKSQFVDNLAESFQLLEVFPE